MIPKHITRKLENDNYRALALYAADAKNGKTGEKTLMSWHDGCLAEDYLTGLIEVEVTQEMNTRTKMAKTYHLMISFRPEDENKLSPKIFREIEKELAKTLGFSEHQRHCGVHKNTDNMHMHIAYNMIHPEKFTRHAPYFDFPKLHKSCRILEQKYGLAVDLGMDENTPKKESKTNVKAQAIEAHTGQESFNSYAIGRKEKIISALKTAKNWNEFHEHVLKMGMEIKPKNNGLAFFDRFGKHSVKASDIDRSLSKKYLEEKLGSFIGVNEKINSSVEVIEKYQPLPLHQDSRRDNLYAQFLAEMEQRKAALEAVKEEERNAFDFNRKKWAVKRKAVSAQAMLPVHKQQLLEVIKAREDIELISNRQTLAEKSKAIREATPYTSWTKFLQHKAAQGNESALAVLRSKKVKPELAIAADSKFVASLEAVKQSKELQMELLQKQGINHKHKQALLAVVKMRELLAKDPDMKKDDLKYKIDTKGTVIFTLASGGTIRDTGKELHFSSHDQAVQKLAVSLAKIKWGRNVGADGNVLHRLNERNKPLAR